MMEFNCYSIQIAIWASPNSIKLIEFRSRLLKLVFIRRRKNWIFFFLKIDILIFIFFIWISPYWQRWLKFASYLASINKKIKDKKSAAFYTKKKKMDESMLDRLSIPTFRHYPPDKDLIDYSVCKWDAWDVRQTLMTLIMFIKQS